MSEVKHTPLPWNATGFIVEAENGRGVTHTGLLGRRHPSYEGQSGGNEDEANAEFIVRACNAHYEMLEALLLFTKSHESLGDLNEPYRKAKSAIAKAKATGQ